MLRREWRGECLSGTRAITVGALDFCDDATRIVSGVVTSNCRLQPAPIC
jgi:hypothetical protein